MAAMRSERISSIGPIGSIQTEMQLHTRRRKGFVTDVVDSRADAARFAKEVLRSEVGMLSADPAGVSRFNIRAIVNTQLLRNGSIDLAHVEAEIPIGPLNRGGNYSIVYFGQNSRWRQLRNRAGERFQRDIEDAYANRDSGALRNVLRDYSHRDRRGRRSVITNYGNGVRGTRVSGEIVQLLGSAFGYDKDEGMAILADPHYTVFIALHNGTVSGMSMAETIAIRTSTGVDLNIVEVTNGAVEKGYGGNGLYGAISSHLIAHLAADKSIDLVYSESNVHRSTLLNAIAMQQRSLAGVMPNNSVVEGELRPMAVTYLNREALDRFYLMDAVRE